MNEFFNGNFEKSEKLTPSQEIAKVLRGVGEELGFDEETCSEIAKLSFEEGLETAYSYLTQAGLNAEEVLAPFLEETEQ